MENMRTIMLEDNNNIVVIGKSSVIGKRKEQQDAIITDDDYSYRENKKAVAVLCDGMGGLNGGAIASQICTAILYQEFSNWNDMDNIPMFYRTVIPKLDMEVNALTDDNGAPLHAGTTMVSVVVKKDLLYWASVGDSHIYIIRNGEMLCITEEHNLMMLLKESVIRGEITEEEANNNPKKEALISFIGMGGVKYVDMNAKPFQLLPGDYVVLCSDGLYRSVTDDEMMNIICSCKSNVQAAAETLTNVAMRKGKKNQDNTSVVVMQYLDSW